MIYVYTIGCPACNVLIKKLMLKNIGATLINNPNEFDLLGITEFPMMRINDGPLMSYSEAIDWVNQQEEQE